MRYYLLTLFILIGTTLQATSLYNETDSIVMYYTDWSVLTDRDISCSEFYSITDNKYVVSDKEIIKNLLDEITGLEKYDPYSLDVRCKVLFFKDGCITTSVCMDAASVLYKGQLFKNSSKLLAIVNHITNSFPCSIPFKNEYGKKTSNVINGEEKVIMEVLRLLKKEKNIKKGFKLVMVCRADAEGNTLDVALPKCPVSIKEKQINRIKEIIKDNIKWNYNEERSPTERLFHYITIKK